VTALTELRNASEECGVKEKERIRFVERGGNGRIILQ